MWEFPEGTVLTQTLSLPQPGVESTEQRRIETRLLTKQLGVWAGYSYLWNDAQDDATLAPAAGIDITLPQTIAGSTNTSAGPRTWKVPSRADCMSCHSRAANFVLGLNDLQSDRDVNIGGVRLNQLVAFDEWKLIGSAPATPAEHPKLVNPYHTSAKLRRRARSYLHVNCSSCHVAAGGGNSRIQLDIQQPRDQLRLVDVPPQHQTFGIPAAMLVKSGDPQHSILFHRLSRRGPGQMPPRGTHVVDAAAVQLIHDWIAAMKPRRKFVKNWTMDELADNLNEATHGRSFETGSKLFNELGCIQCHRFAAAGGGAGPDLSGIAERRAPSELLESILEPSKHIAPEFAATVVITTSGKTFEGRIGQEDGEKLVLHTADSLAEPLVVARSEIDEQYPSTKSTMPEGLLNTLEKLEILDLLAYMLADADSNHPAFAK
jgi:putative heme-binding domain-containing protein